MTFRDDLHLALRTLRGRPGFYAAAVLTLTVGIGANVTVFSIVNAMLLRPLPFGERSGRVVTLFSTHAQQPEDWSWGDSELSYPDLVDLREATTLEGLGGYLSRSLTLSRDGAAERVSGGSVTVDLFPMLGIAPVLGRPFRPEEAAAPGLERVVMLTHGLWQRRYGAASDIVGRDIYVNGLPRTVVGVLPAGFRFPERDDLYLPLHWAEASRAARNVNGVGLLKAGATIAQAQDELAAIAGRLAREHADTNRGFGVRVMAFRDSQIAPDSRVASMTLLAAVALVLLVACANLTNLMLVRASHRQREMAVRAALGAGRGQLLRHLLAETALVVTAGAALGLGLSVWALDVIRALIPEDLPYWLTFDPDARTLTFTSGVAALTTIGVGLAPALRASRPNLLADLKDSVRTTVSRRQQRLQSGLVIAQVAVCLALLTGASMMVRGFVSLQSSDLGFDHRPLVSLRIYMAGDEYDPLAARARFVDDVVATLAALPGASSAAAMTAIPGDDGGALVRVVDDARAGPDDGVGAQAVGASAEVFATLGLALLEGRPLTAGEAHDPDARVTVVGGALARRMWPDGDAVGRRLGVRTATGVDWYRIVGVAPDVHFEEVGEANEQSRLHFFVPALATGNRSMAFLVRAEAPERLVGPIRAALRRRVPDQPVFDLMTMPERRRFTTWEQRFFGEMMAVFATMALALAGLGVYALLSYAARRRLPEIGIRLALGASPGDVVRMFLRQGLRLSAAGIATGLVLAAGLVGALERVVYGGDAWDPRHVLTAIAGLTATVLAASIVPARRAARTDPTSALRAE